MDWAENAGSQTPSTEILQPEQDRAPAAGHLPRQQVTTRGFMGPINRLREGHDDDVDRHPAGRSAASRKGMLSLTTLEDSSSRWHGTLALPEPVIQIHPDHPLPTAAATKPPDVGSVRKYACLTSLLYPRPAPSQTVCLSPTVRLTTVPAGTSIDMSAQRAQKHTDLGVAI